MGAEYRPDRRADKVPRVHRITSSEATETTDLKRLTTYERERERIADELRLKKEGRSFSDVMRRKK